MGNKNTVFGDAVYNQIGSNKRRLGNIVLENSVPFEGGAGAQRGLFIASLIMQLDAQLAYETGFNIGGTASYAAEALAYTGGRFVGFELKTEVKPVVDEFLRIYPHAEMVWGDSQVTLRERWERTQERPDFFFVDGGHSQKVCAYDFNHALQIVKPGGIIMVDDISNPPISDFIRQLIPENGSLWFEGKHQGTGVAIYQVPGK